MAEGTLPTGRAPAAASALSWRRISPRLVPIMAVITALAIGVPFMILTSGRGDIQRGLNVAGTAYSGLIEGAIGIAINDLVSPDNLDLALALAETEDLTERDATRLARGLADVAAVGVTEVRRYGDVLTRFENLTDEEIDEIGERLPDIATITPATLDAMRGFAAAFSEADRGDVRDLAEGIALLESVTDEDRAGLIAQYPTLDTYSSADLLTYFRILNQYGIVRLERLIEQMDALPDLGIDPTSGDATDLAAIAVLEAAEVRDLVETGRRVEDAGITDLALLNEQLQLVRNLYDEELLTNESVAAALQTELEPALQNYFLMRRPGNRLVVGAGSSPFGILYAEGDTSAVEEAVVEESAEAPAEEPTETAAEVPERGAPEIVYLRLGGSALVFFPSQLESTLVRSIPFVIAGLAVALGFKAGLFNIGAEGQLYIGSILAVWIGFSPIFAGLPPLLHIPLAILGGIIGGALWGAIPGALKAFTGAHEVINTIMLNFVAIRLVDWLIKSTDPVIMLDQTASTPRTPFISPSAMLPTFDNIPTIWFFIAGAFVLAWGLWSQRERFAQNPRVAIRPVVNAVIVVVVGLFLSWVTVRGNLHIGLVIMVLAVWFTEWFLTRTTLGFELRTVGTNPDAARYAGMSVKFNLILAMALSGALAGLAGVNEISGVQHNLQPDFFSGLGFDAIAVALLARTNPRNMIAAGLLWGGLLSGAGLMQVRANISIDLVRIIQALIIMFIAADVIIRYIWRVPEQSTEEKAAAMFSKGWGG